jgi:hypothetical protein
VDTAMKMEKTQMPACVSMDGKELIAARVIVFEYTSIITDQQVRLRIMQSEWSDLS